MDERGLFVDDELGGSMQECAKRFVHSIACTIWVSRRQQANYKNVLPHL